MPLPFIAHPAPPPFVQGGFSERSGLLFIGVAHTSAAESMHWFLKEVHPRIVAKLRNHTSAATELAHLTIVGWGWKDLSRHGPGCSKPSHVMGRASRCNGAFRGLAAAEALSLSPAPASRSPAELLTLMHSVHDSVLTSLFASRRVFIAPCPYCTGVATKVVTALRHGIPVVGTSEIGRGILDFLPSTLGPPPLELHDDPDAFAAAAVALLVSKRVWTHRSDAALRYAREALGEATLDQGMRSLASQLIQKASPASPQESDQAAVPVNSAVNEAS